MRKEGPFKRAQLGQRRPQLGQESPKFPFLSHFGVLVPGFRVYGLGLVAVGLLGYWLSDCWVALVRLGAGFVVGSGSSWIVGLLVVGLLSCWAVGVVWLCSVPLRLGSWVVGLLSLFAGGLLLGLGFKVWVWLLLGC